jgi:hypothetical protein
VLLPYKNPKKSEKFEIKAILPVLFFINLGG